MIRHLVLCVIFILFSSIPVNSETSTEIPIQIEGKVVFLKVLVNNKGPFLFVLDTGATISIMTPAAADKAGLSGKARSVTSPTAGVIQKINIGDIEIKKMPVKIFDPPQAVSLRLNNGIDYSGILGYTFLTNFITTIDYNRRILLLNSPMSGKSVDSQKNFSSEITKVPLRLNDGLLYVSTLVNGKGPYVFIIDTGSAEVVLKPDLVLQAGLKITASDNAQNALFGATDAITIGKTTATNVPVIVRRFSADSRQYDGILGYPFLSNFIITINYQDRSLTLLPSKKAGCF